MKDPKDILAQLTLEEKADLCDGSDYWHLQGMEKYGVPTITICDGPHGLRKKDYDKKGISLSASIPAICFPSAATTACSWDPDLLSEMGEALGRKCQKEQVGILLGPGINMKRSPLCGRNFEYFSEDPVLAGELAAGLICGLQSMGVGASLKHFAVNNQETRRMTCDSVVDERTLRELYLTGFEIAVKKSKPWTVMNSYNKINGVHGSENRYTQIDILRKEWGYDGCVVSDWGAVNDRVEGIRTGNDLEMPSSSGAGKQKIIDAVKSGDLEASVLDERVLNVLTLIKKAADGTRQNASYDDLDDQPLARRIAAQSMVLMKNDGILPLKKSGKIAVIGDMAKNPRYQGAGSSHITPTKLENAYDELAAKGYALAYAPGYARTEKNKKKNAEHLRNAVALAGTCDTVLLFIGLTEELEAEGYDRQSMALPQSHNALVREILKVNKNVVVVLSGGSPAELPWAANVRAILNSYLGGQAGGGAVADLLSGDRNPCGKLAETWPLHYGSTPARLYFPCNPATVEYRESIYIGYRYYEKSKKEVRFPFGHGLSYTTFAYSDLQLDKTAMQENNTLKASVKIKNTGAMPGYEITQLYVSDLQSTIFRPEKELKAFKKIYLEPGEEKQITFELSKRAFAFYNTAVGDWCVESGSFQIMIGASSADIRLSATVHITAAEVAIPDYTQTAPAYYTGNVQNVPDDQFVALLGKPLPQKVKSHDQPIDLTDNFENANYTKWGKRIYKTLNVVVPAGMARAIALQTPFRNFISMSGGVFHAQMADGLLKVLNGEKRGFRTIIKGVPKLIRGIGPLFDTI
ncbi:MAG: glycoside hydrolase family 3 C-terminal domain-containing protein [Clostridia bacterium]|nr:glycoside hydrolase family 3 C-terminal domain-containing protein [Clostridia bacterium]